MMWNRLHRWLNDIPVNDPIARQQAPLLQMMLLSIVLVAALRPLLFLFDNRDGINIWVDLGMSTMVLTFSAIAVSVLRSGRFRFAVLLATTGFLLVLGIVLLSTGLHSSGLVPFVFALPITLVGLLAGRRGLLFTGALSIAIVAITAFLELRSPPLAGFAPLPNPPADMALTFALITSLLVTFLSLFGQSLRKALAVALDHERKLEQARASFQMQAAELAAANADLEREIAERKNLEAQLVQSQRLESIGRLAGGVAHDFNNLLTSIIGNSELALDSLPAEHPVRADLSEITKSANRATALTRQLLAFARKQLIEPRVVDLNQLVIEMDKLLRRLIGEHVELTTLLETDLWRVRADPGQIEQVIINLAVNARDAMPNGGKLTIETKNVLLDHDYAHRHISVSPGNYVLLAISDTGTGMDEEIRGRVFEPFFTTKPPGYGTGLGLATCYGIVKQHGGNIWPYSEPGHGSTFKIYLPQVEAPAEALPRSIQAGDLPRGTETILLAEDEPSVRMLAGRVLRSLGYTVIEATNGDEALNLARSWGGSAITLLLTDVVMPHMSGEILAERITERYPDIKVLFISGYTDNAIVHHGRLDPDVVFLQKPFSPSALAHKVREVLGHPTS